MPARYLTIADISAELQVSRSQARRIVRELLHYQVGRIIRVPRAAFEVYLRRNETAG